MFFTLGIIIGIAVGWFANEKWDDIKSASAKAMFWKK
jgi:Na+/H+-dicarboxylate symporter|tara:strand:+ start:597 stop:707 length:111 start_codon:yes stop_codon:yes gene_type:complete